MTISGHITFNVTGYDELTREENIEYIEDLMNLIETYDEYLEELVEEDEEDDGNTLSVEITLTYSLDNQPSITEVFTSVEDYAVFIATLHINNNLE